jgi:signal transduction histidine kinase/ActR/RegA family two-component response regulator
MPEFAAPESVLTKNPRDAQARAGTVRLLQVLAAAALLLPVLFFAFASALSHRSTYALADERIERSLDVLQEQALKVFQSMNLALDTIENMVAGLSEAEIRANEEQLHMRLRQIQGALPEVQSIWIFGPTGHPQVITRDYPAPYAEDFGALDYFVGPRDGRGVYIGGIHQSVSGGQPYFSFSRARHDASGKFVGVIEMSLLPGDFSRFYSHLLSGEGLQFALVRDDGVMLARYPPISRDVQLGEHSGFHRSIAADPAGGFYTSVGENDNVERRVGTRRLPGFPIYVIVGIDTVQIRNEWMGGMAMHLIFGIPATLFLFLTLLAVLRRTRRLYAEQDQRLAVEETLRQSQKLDAIGHLTGGVAHDFNNLLTIIIGNLEVAQRQLESWTDAVHGKLAQRIGSAMHGAERAATLTKRLLAFARQQPLNPAAIDVNRLLNGLSDFLHRALGEDVSLEIVGTGGVWPVEADPAELEAAVLNLAVNARDAMPDGGKMTIETSNAYLDDAYCRQYPDARPGQYVQVSVTDTGAGMTSEIIERAFEPFFTTKQAGQGTGLGLSQVYGFVKQSGGHVKIYSEVGEGTSIKMYLPRFTGQASPSAETKSEPRRGRSDECILVVEDDAEVRAYVVETLRGLGYDVIEAPGAEEALALLDRHKTISLLLTDVVMPGQNGRKLAEAARARQASLKVLYMTGYSRNAIVHQGRLDPGVELLQKPLTSEQLATTVRKILDAQGL